VEQQLARLAWAMACCAGVAVACPAAGQTRPAPRPGFPALVQINADAAGNDTPNEYANEPMLVVDPQAPSRLFVAWNHFERPGPGALWGHFQSAYSVSLDGGRTWWPRARLEPGVRRANHHAAVLPVPVDGAGFAVGSAYVNDQTIYFGSLWFADRVGGALRGKVSTPPHDKPWIFADAVAGSPGFGNLYTSWNSVVNPATPNIFARSFTGGRTWTAPSGMPASPSLGSIAVGPDGAVYVSGIVNIEPSNLFMVARSDDAWNPLVAVPTFSTVRVGLNGAVFPVATGPNPGGPLQQVRLIVDTTTGPRRGWVYFLTSADPTGTDPCDVFFSRSSDRGATWSAPVKVNTDAARSSSWQWFAAMDQAPNGRLDVVWLDSRDSRDNATMRLYYRSSADGGATWGTEQALSAPFNLTTGWGYEKKIGDYFTLVSDNLGASLAWTSTLRGPQDVYFTRIGPEDCNRNGLDDASELASGSAADCNGNGVPDSCDIAAGLEVDANSDGVPDSCAGTYCEATDYNRSGATDLDDLADYLADYYTLPAIPGGMQVDAPSYAGERVGFMAACPGAGDAPPPYAPESYRVAGYRVGFSIDGSQSCPMGVGQVFPNLDHLGDFITLYFGGVGGGCGA
jgi:hypothetical protein